MKYFNNLEGIFEECYNLERGKDNQNNLYPLIDYDGVQTHINASYGFIFVNSINTKQFAELLRDKLISFPVNNRKVCLETGTSDFSILSAINNSLETEMNYTGNKHVLRNIVYIDNIKPTNMLGNSKFTWFVYSLYSYIYNLLKIENGYNPVDNIFTVIYDPLNLFSLEPNLKYYRNIIPQDIKCLKNCISITPYGIFNQEFYNKNIQTNNSNISSLLVKYKNSINYPELLAIEPFKFCFIRKGALEIIRHLGNYNIYSDIRKVEYLDIDKPIYPINFEQIYINHQLYRKPNDVCCNCDTPLYDDIYIITLVPINNTYKNIIECIAYCDTCFHAAFYYDKYSLSGNRLYNEVHYIGYTIFPRTYKEVISQIKIPKIREIITLMYEKITYNLNKHGYNIYMGKYLGIDYDLTKYVFEAKEEDYDKTIISLVITNLV